MIKSPIRINGSLDRQENRRTPTETEIQCPHFKKRFIGWGRLNERRAICDAQHTQNLACDYRHVTKDGTALCLRYHYGPKYEIVDEVDEPYVQKVNQYGQQLYYDEDGNETTTVTTQKVMVPISEANPVPYLAKYTVQKRNAADQPLFWDTTVDPKVETTANSGYDSEGNLVAFKPVLVVIKPHFFSNQYIDTHGKVFGHNGNELGWHYNV